MARKNSIKAFIVNYENFIIFIPDFIVYFLALSYFSKFLFGQFFTLIYFLWRFLVRAQCLEFNVINQDFFFNFPLQLSTNTFKVIALYHIIWNISIIIIIMFKASSSWMNTHCRRNLLSLAFISELAVSSKQKIQM